LRVPDDHAARSRAAPGARLSRLRLGWDPHAHRRAPRRCCGGAPGCPFNSGDIDAVGATAGAVYIGGHLTNLCTVRNTSDTLRCPGPLTVRTHVAALDPATGVPSPGTPDAGAPINLAGIPRRRSDGSRPAWPVQWRAGPGR
jgi:hypothetical protein